MIQAEYKCTVCGEKFLSEIELNKHRRGKCTKGEAKGKTADDKTPLDKVEDTIDRTHSGYEGQGSRDVRRTR